MCLKIKSYVGRDPSVFLFIYTLFAMAFKFKHVLIILFILSYILGSALVGHKHKEHYLSSDGEGYYLYLPAVFIYKTFENIPVNTPDQYKPYPNTNKIATRFTYGVALMELPFFLISQASRYFQNLPLDSAYSNDMCVLVLIASCFYSILGLYFIHQLLIEKFSKTVVYFTLAALYLGTNLFWYTIREPAMSHSYSFFLVSVLLYKTNTLFKTKPSVKAILGVSIVLALITLIRPVNGILYLLIPFYGVASLRDFKDRMAWIIGNKLHFFLPSTLLLVFLPQMYYWHYLSGKWLLNTYALLHEQSFNWSNPHLWDVFFSIHNGFFVYTPMMILALFGLLMMVFKREENGVLFLILFSILAFICACWFMWWFGHSVGFRPFIDFYPLLVGGLAYFLSFAFAKNNYLKYATQLVVLTLILVNIRILITPFYWDVQPNENSVHDFNQLVEWVLDITKW